MSHTVTADRAVALSRFRLLGLWIPLAIFALVAVAQVVLLPRVPAQMAIHWDGSGQPDGFSASWTFPLMTLLVGAGTVALIGGLALAGTRESASVDLRFVAATTLFVAGFLAPLMLWLFLLQVDVTDTAAVDADMWMTLVFAVVGLALGVVGWTLTPRHTSPDDVASSPEPVSLRAGEKAVWLRTTSLGRAGVTVLIVGVAAALGAAALVIPSGDPVAIWVTIGSLALVVVLGGALSVFRVRVDESGLTLRSVVGRPRIHIPAGDVEAAEVVQVNPMADFGGYGWRLSPTHGRGVVTRTGEALRVRRSGGSLLTVTVDDATTAAALLRTYQERHLL